MTVLGGKGAANASGTAADNGPRKDAFVDRARETRGTNVSRAGGGDQRGHIGSACSSRAQVGAANQRLETSGISHAGGEKGGAEVVLRGKRDGAETSSRGNGTHCFRGVANGAADVVEVASLKNHGPASKAIRHRKAYAVIHGQGTTRIEGDRTSAAEAASTCANRAADVERACVHTQCSGFRSAGDSKSRGATADLGDGSGARQRCGVNVDGARARKGQRLGHANATADRQRRTSICTNGAGRCSQRDKAVGDV